jgi:hypothetical protein
MATPAPVPTTAGELLFQDYLDLMRYPYEFEKEFPGKKKRPDYTVTRNGVFLFDVKDFDPYMPLGFAAYDPYPRIREKIEEGREKFKQFKEFPCSLVLKNNGNTFVHLESVDIMLECSVCHGSVTIVSGQWKTRNDSRYGCSMHAYRGDRVCTNNLLVSRMALEEQLLAGLQAKVLHPDVVEYAFRRFEEQLARSMNRQGSETAALCRSVEEKEKEIRNCTRAISSMGLSSALRVQLTDLEMEHRELTEKLAGSEPRAVRLQLGDTRRFVEARLRNLQSMWTGEARLVRAEIAKHVEKITLTPEGRTYIASGSWDLLGGVAVRMVPGARIELATPAFSGRRSTNELPRHKGFRNCRGLAQLCQFDEKRSANQFADSSNSFIQLRFLRTSRGLVPSGGPTMPSFSMRSIKRAARP